MSVTAKETTCERVKLVLDVISNAEELYAGDRTPYVYGMGGQSVSYYRRFARRSGVELKWTGSTMHGVARMLSVLIPSHAGILQVIDTKVLKPVFIEVSDSTMTGVYIFNKYMEQTFIEQVSGGMPLADIDNYVLTDHRSFIYQLDSNNPSSKSGMFEFMQGGIDFSVTVRQTLSM